MPPTTVYNYAILFKHAITASLIFIFEHYYIYMSFLMSLIQSYVRITEYVVATVPLAFRLEKFAINSGGQQFVSESVQGAAKDV